MKPSSIDNNLDFINGKINRNSVIWATRIDKKYLVEVVFDETDNVYKMNFFKPCMSAFNSFASKRVPPPQRKETDALKYQKIAIECLNRIKL